MLSANRIKAIHCLVYTPCFLYCIVIAEVHRSIYYQVNLHIVFIFKSRFNFN